MMLGKVVGGRQGDHRHTGACAAQEPRRLARPHDARSGNTVNDTIRYHSLISISLNVALSLWWFLFLESTAVDARHSREGAADSRLRARPTRRRRPVRLQSSLRVVVVVARTTNKNQC
jgi:hypothetical protein